jgi:hypothetical protein
MRALAAFGVLLAVIATRVVTSARDELLIADGVRARGDLDGAIIHYRRAARWYAPGSPFHVEALDHLAALGRQAAAAGDVERALSAERAIRAAILGARSFYTPERARLDGANQRIAALMASQPAPAVDSGKSRARLTAEHLALLRAPHGPSVPWTVVLLLGFGTWVAAAFLFVARAIDTEDRVIGAQARVWGTLIVLGFGVFVVGMALA